MKRIWIGIVLALVSSLALSVGESCATENSDATTGTIEVTPAVGGIFVDGDNNKFREDWWMEDGARGGLEKFSVHHDLNADTAIEAEGRAIAPDEDYRIDLRIDKRDVGYVRAGFKQYRKYFDDTGGFFNSFSDSSFDLGKDMHLNIGTAFIEAGLTLPNAPKVVLGFEHRYKNGEKSLLEWGRVDGGGFSRNIFPSYKEFDEEVNVVRLEVSHDIANVHLGDEFRYENYRILTTRHDEEFNIDTAESSTEKIDDNYRHDAFFNTLHAESHINDKTFVSVGYLFTTLDGDASFNILTVPGTSFRDLFYDSHSISLEQDVHIASANAVFGPFADATIYVGLQGEKLDKKGDTAVNLAEVPITGPPAEDDEAVINSDEDKWGIEETLGVRYQGLPRTTVYVEGRWTQQNINLKEYELTGIGVAPTVDVDRDTNAHIRRERYSIGFNSSPLPRTTIYARYRHGYRSNDYNHRVDNTANSYSAFILDQDLKSDEVMVKVAFRPIAGIRTSLQYQLMTMDIDTDLDTDPPTSRRSADYDANIYTASVTATPLAGLFVTGMVSYQDVMLKTTDLSGGPIANYKGDVWSLTASAGVAVDTKTNLNLQYTYSMTEDFQDITSVGLPLGSDTTRHAVIARLDRKITDNLSVQMRYGFYNYDDEASDGSDNYSAHLVGASARMIF